MITRPEIAAIARREGRVAVALITEAHGSTPRDAGAALAVWDGGGAGSVGGGAVEHRVLERARSMLANGETRAEMAFPLGPDLDQCCGGRMTVAIAVLEAADVGSDGSGGQSLWPGGPQIGGGDAARPVIVYGAGHVGQALVAALAPLPFRVTWTDSRPGLMAGAPEGVEAIETPLPEALAGDATPEAMHVVLTHSHALDLEIIAAVQGRPFAFCGLIGSETKLELFRRRLSERGIGSTALDRITCPIGVPGIPGKAPAVIAAAVAAQLLAVDAECGAAQMAGG